MSKFFLTACIWIIWVALLPDLHFGVWPVPFAVLRAGPFAQAETPAAPSDASSTGGGISAVETVTPVADGAIIHKVQSGQSLWGIATAYGIKFEELLGYNQLDPAAVIHPGDALVVRPSFTPTVTPTATPILPRSTRTVRPTRPPAQPTPTQTATPAPTLTLPPLLPIAPEPGDSSRRLLGGGMIAVCALGLLMVVINALRPKR